MRRFRTPLKKLVVLEEIANQSEKITEKKTPFRYRNNNTDGMVIKVKERRFRKFISIASRILVNSKCTQTSSPLREGKRTPHINHEEKLAKIFSVSFTDICFFRCVYPQMAMCIVSCNNNLGEKPRRHTMTTFTSVGIARFMFTTAPFRVARRTQIKNKIAALHFKQSPFNKVLSTTYVFIKNVRSHQTHLGRRRVI